MYPSNKSEPTERGSRFTRLRIAIDLFVIFIYIMFGRRLPGRRYRDVGPEGRFLFGMLLWIGVMALIDRGAVWLIAGQRTSHRSERTPGLILLAAGFALGAMLVYFRFPPELFAWFTWAFTW